MTKSLSEVVHQIEILSENEQNEIANLITEELNWKNAFANSEDVLSMLAEDAIEEFKSGKTKKVDL